MSDIGLLRAQPDAVAPPTATSASVQLLLAVKKNKTERPLHGGQHYSKFQTVTALNV